MYLRRLLSVVCVCALACGLFSCGKQRAEPYEPKYSGDTIAVEQADVAVSRKVTNQGFLDLLERMRGDEYRPLAKSRVVSRQQSYREHWSRVVYYAFPKFMGEIKGPGARKIKQYYKERYRACAAEEGFPWLDTEIADTPEQAMQYRLQVYAVDLLDDCVVVNFYTEAYLGGSRAEPLPTADVFDRQTGNRLALDDVINVEEAADAINKAVADTLKAKDIRPHAPYDIRGARDQMFSLTEESLTLLFAPGTLASPAYGAIKVPVMRAALGLTTPKK